jgi:hypothetical protein
MTEWRRLVRRYRTAQPGYRQQALAALQRHVVRMLGANA